MHIDFLLASKCKIETDTSGGNKRGLPKGALGKGWVWDMGDAWGMIGEGWGSVVGVG